MQGWLGGTTIVAKGNNVEVLWAATRRVRGLVAL